MRRLVLVPLFLMTVVLYQNCGSSFIPSSETVQNSVAGTGGGEGAGAESNPPATPTPAPSGSMRLVTIGVGVGGRRVSGINGYASIIADFQNLSANDQALVQLDPSDSTKLICPTGWSQVAMKCCLAGGAYDCVGVAAGYHSDFLFRGITYGNGRFVAVGGASFAITQVSSDGITWSPKYNLVASAGLVTGAKSSADWLAGVAYGNGRFVAVEGYSGGLIYSTDGMNWVHTGSFPAVRNSFRRLYFLGNRFYAAGDNGGWGFTDDGTKWTSTGISVGPTDVYQVGSVTYGFDLDKIYRLPTPTSTVWEPVYTHPTTIGSFVYNNALQTFNIFTSNSSTISGDPSTGWVTTAARPPGRWDHFTGAVFVGGATSYSADGLIWKTTPSPMGFSQLVNQYASGLVPE